jgi:hypothetical protein
VDYSPHIVESAMEVLVKEERRLEAIPAVVLPPIFLRWWPAAPMFRSF